MRIAVVTLLVALAALAANAQPELALARSGTLAEITAGLQGRADLGSIVDGYGQGLLEYAAGENPSPEVITQLIAFGLDVNRGTPAGWTPIMYAARFNPVPEVAQALLDAGADARAANPDGQRAIDLTSLNPNPSYSLHRVAAALAAATATPTPPPPAPPIAPAPSRSCIDINSASVADVQRIIHIGPARAPEFVARRPYRSVAELTRINGIGPARIRDIQAQGLACVR